MGGAIWGDNALPGWGSRFDVAFRREMKRVVPDIEPSEPELLRSAFVHGVKRMECSFQPRA